MAYYTTRILFYLKNKYDWKQWKVDPSGTLNKKKEKYSYTHLKIKISKKLFIYPQKGNFNTHIYFFMFSQKQK